MYYLQSSLNATFLHGQDCLSEVHHASQRYHAETELDKGGAKLICDGR